MRFMVNNRMLKNPLLHFILIAALGILVYSNTFEVPFQFDDRMFIEENPLIKDLSYFINPSQIDDLKLKAKDGKKFFGTRYVSLLSLGVNYRLGGLDVTGYHIVNTTVHVINALLVYLFVTLFFRAPSLTGSSLESHSWLIALFSGLLFVAHPIQTMAVTYILQRWACIAAMFYLLSVVSYLRWRLIPSSLLQAKGVLYFLALFSAVLAMKSKENAFTLPLMIALCEFMFFKGGIMRRTIYLIPFFLTMLIIPLEIMSLNNGAEGISGNLKSAATLWGAPDRMDYFLSQFGVITKYISLIFMPVGVRPQFA